MDSPRILLFDIETSQNIVGVFELRQRDGWIRPDNILQERYIISISWMWLDETTVHAVSVLDDPKLFAKDPHNDKHVLEVFHKVVSEADVTVFHNGKAFDDKFVNTRALVHKLPPLPPIPHLDTMGIAKQKFLFNSNSLDYLGKLLGVGKKLDHPSGLWMAILRGGDEAVKAIKKMVTYNKQDVLLLKEVFLKLRPYMPDHINRQLFNPKDGGCPRCGSLHFQKRGLRHAISRVYQQFQCLKCGGWWRSAKPIPQPAPTSRVL